ncbi:hypothetical protein GH714_023066 [Hevea brasiliensis]|uniref:Uncharacterized protein n=1 Tax=Hevea brasiliensis TaxID=3981 RepID=A0A6A6KKX1_HEVBR|nr:hypothetical protein GH714_023066 [Hevea brasiliensis]
MDLEPDSSFVGLSAVSGDKLAGVAIGGLLVEGKTIGASTGVAELEGILADASGVAAVAGPSVTGGLAIGAEVGVVTGVAAGVETDGGGVVGDKTGGDPLGDGGTTEVGDGRIAGEILGDCAGDFEGEEEGVEDGEVTGELAGEVVGDLAGALTGEVVGDSAGALAGEETGDLAESLQHIEWAFMESATIDKWKAGSVLAFAGVVEMKGSKRSEGGIYRAERQTWWFWSLVKGNVTVGMICDGYSGKVAVTWKDVTGLTSLLSDLSKNNYYLINFIFNYLLSLLNISSVNNELGGDF